MKTYRKLQIITVVVSLIIIIPCWTEIFLKNRQSHIKATLEATSQSELKDNDVEGSMLEKETNSEAKDNDVEESILEKETNVDGFIASEPQKPYAYENYSNAVSQAAYWNSMVTSYHGSNINLSDKLSKSEKKYDSLKIGNIFEFDENEIPKSWNVDSTWNLIKLKDPTKVESYANSNDNDEDKYIYYLFKISMNDFYRSINEPHSVFIGDYIQFS